MNNNPSVLEIDLSAIEHNLKFFGSKLQQNTKILAVVKASGYGSGACEVAKFLENLGVDYFAVAYADEGIALRNADIKTPILVLHPQLQNLHLLVKYNLEPNLYSKKILLSFLEIANKSGTHHYPIHLKFNTGLNRLGFRSSDIAYIFNHLKETSSVKVKSIFSHLAASEDEKERKATLYQIEKFNLIAATFENTFGFMPIRHMSNTSGILNYPEAHFDMVRLGIGLYGFTNVLGLNQELRNVLRLKSVISQIHDIEKGESIGYNRGHVAEKRMRTATIPLGHADGIFRCLGQGRIFVKINGQKALVIGNICMDMIMVDVTEVACEENDQVVIFDSQDDILNIATQANTISYEILTAIGERIKRVSV